MTDSHEDAQENKQGLPDGRSDASGRSAPGPEVTTPPTEPAGTAPPDAAHFDPALAGDEQQARQKSAAGQTYDLSWQAPPLAPWRRRIHEIIFEADTTEGKLFDIVLLIAIFTSVGAVMLESVDSVRREIGPLLLTLEWSITLLFTLEYILRLVAVRKPWRYAKSFFGIVDLIATIPTYLVFFVADAQALAVVRALRLLRVFRVLKMVRYLSEAQALRRAMQQTRAKITVFLVIVMTIVLVLGSLMYLIEGPEHGFTSIPISVYWAIVTMTTVGYGDVAPQTVLGRVLAALAMIIGYTIIVIPVGVFAVEVINESKREISTQACPVCSREGHDIDAVHCKYCGGRL